MTRLRFLRIYDFTKGGYRDQPGDTCWLDVDLKIVQQVHRMMQQHSLQTVDLVPWRFMQSLKPASRHQSLQQTSSSDRVTSRHWKLHQLEDRPLDEEQVCADCGSIFPSMKPISVEVMSCASRPTLE